MKKYSKKIDFNTEDYNKSSISDLKRMADYWLRQYLLRGNESTYYFCPLKGKSYSADNMEVAHFIDRQCMNTRFDLDNCYLVSKQSNTWDAQVPRKGYKSKHHYDYEQYLGSEIVENLREKSKIIKVFSRQDYIEVIEKFRDEQQ